jgi:hypothetical protein
VIVPVLLTWVPAVCSCVRCERPIDRPEDAVQVDQRRSGRGWEPAVAHVDRSVCAALL